ncbi:hypothetical protein [Microtetraspora malaysiensis]
MVFIGVWERRSRMYGAYEENFIAVDRAVSAYWENRPSGIKREESEAEL